MVIDDFDNYRSEEMQELDKTLAKLLECELGEWDQDFVDDLVKRLNARKLKSLTPLQWEQVERMERRYL